VSIRIVHGADAVRRELIARHGELAVVDEAARQRASAVFDESLNPREFVARVVERVQTDGDVALREIAAKVGDHIPTQFEVSPDELSDARAKAPPDLAADLEVAAERIRAFHLRQLPADFFDDASGVGQRWSPVDRAGIHIPGASGPLASSVLMTAIPARVAGVREVVVCTPAAEDGIDPVIALAAHVAEVDRVFLVSGAQAIAAMAVGTASVSRCDAVVAPGNAWVVLATREVFGLTGVSVLPGPTETLVIADATCPPAAAATDVVLQAEHGPGGRAWLVTWDDECAEAVCSAIGQIVDLSPRRVETLATLKADGFVCLVDGPAQAADVANFVAPEHLQLMCEGAEDLVSSIRHAGAVFIGPWAPASVGDYVAGPSHVLPTAGTARFAGALTTDDFTKRMHVVDVSEAGFDQLAPAVAELAEAEGLWAHAASVSRRKEWTTTGVRP